jgi:hypothetical protein
VRRWFPPSPGFVGADVRVRVTLSAGLLLVVGILVLNMSQAAPRTAGSDHTSLVTVSASVPGGGRLCQIAPRLPAEAASAQVFIRTHGRPVPDLKLRFVGTAKSEVAAGHRPAGGREGLVTIPLSLVSAAKNAKSVCVLVGGTAGVFFEGERGGIGRPSEVVNGRRQPGRITVLYVRSGKQTWWEMLGVLDRRFGLGKASFFGNWTLVVVALALLAIWIAVIRLLARELK